MVLTLATIPLNTLTAKIKTMPDLIDRCRFENITFLIDINYVILTIWCESYGLSFHNRSYHNFRTKCCGAKLKVNVENEKLTYFL